MQSSPYNLEGKTAIVFGAANGIGRAITIAFAEAGANVVCADIDESGATTTASQAGSRTIALRTDVTKLDEIRRVVARAIERFGGLDVLVYGAAVREPTATLVDLDEKVWDQVLRVNLTGAFLACKAAIPAMIERGGGSIILIASQLGRVGSPGRGVYCATKGALIQLAKVVAADHAAENIRVNTHSPGSIETERVVFRYGDIAKARATMGPKHLLGRLGTPEEIARAALFLASDASSFMTAADMLVDGGYTAV